MSTATSVTAEEQALMALKLAESVRELIRKEVKEALQDYGFMSSVDTYPLFTTMQGRHINDPTLKAGVRAFLRELLIT